MRGHNLRYKKFTDSAIWQWRILLVKKYSKSPEPFHYSNQIGIDFNVGSSGQKVTDLQLLTNGVLLELHAFAETVIQRKGHLITNILENNFDLGLENEQQRDDFTACILLKVEDLIRNPIIDEQDAFILFDSSPRPACDNRNNGPSMLSTELKTENLVIELHDSPDEHKEEFESSGEPTQSTKKLRDDGLPSSFPCCEEIGLKLEVGPKQSLDPRLLTKGAMLELAEFTELRASSLRHIVQHLLDYNFDNAITLQTAAERSRLWFRISWVIQLRKLFDGHGRKTPQQLKRMPLFNNELFVLYPIPCKRTRSSVGLNLPLDGTNEGDLGTDDNLWELRADRVKQILQDHQYDAKIKGGDRIEYTVGISPKQNIGFDKVTKGSVMYIARFALAMNASLQNFIMEILDHNFDLSFDSMYLKNTFAHEAMNAVTQLKQCEDGIRFSKDTFELPVQMSSTNANPNNDSADPELSNMPRMAYDEAPMCPPDSHAADVQRQSADLNPFCKEIGLRLHVLKSQPYQTLDIRKLTKGAMTEVTHFAEKLCGTFEELVIDILNHNFGSKSGDSDWARDIVAQIPDLVSRLDLAKSTTARIKDLPFVTRRDSLSNPNVEVLSTGSSMVQVTDPDVGSAPENEEENKHQKKMWQLRENQLQRILSMPHEENCPLYPYSRCKKAGVDFNLGSGVKQNLDKKLITNGVLVEINAVAFEMKSSTEDFLTEILQYNFDLNIQDELSYYAFGKKTMARIRAYISCNNFSQSRNKAPFKLPNSLYINKSNDRRKNFCPKCFLHRKNEACQVEPDSDHMRHPRPHATSDTVSAEANCTELNPANDPSTSSPTFEETIMDGYPKCKEVGLSLCINKDKPKEKLSTSVLTFGIMHEVACFAKVLAGRSKPMTVNEILEHNFNFGFQRRGFAESFRSMIPSYSGLAWFDEVFVFGPRSDKEPPKLETGAATERKEETIEKMLAMQANEERVLLPGQHLNKLKSSKKRFKSCYYPSDEGDGHKTSQQLKRKPIFNDEEFLLNPIPCKRTKSSVSSEQKKQTLVIRNQKRCRTGESEVMDTNGFDYMCPREEPDLWSYKVTDSGDGGDLDPSSDPISCSMRPDVPREPKSSRLGMSETFLTVTEGSSSLQFANSTLNLPLDGTNQGDLGTEENLWKLRADRVKQILQDHKYDAKMKTRRIEYNVGISPKQNIGFDNVNKTFVMYIARFALAMNASQQDFIMEILEHNFDLSFDSMYLKNTFAHEVMNAVTQLKQCEDGIRFSKDTFELPVQMSSTNANPNNDSADPELRNMPRMAYDVAPMCPPDSHAADVQRQSADLNPFCKEIGLRLHVLKSQPYQTLDIRKLTKGAMTEVTHFAEKLCGTFEELVIDILNHNFGSKSGDSDLARDIVAQIPDFVSRHFLTQGLKFPFKPFQDFPIVTQRDSSHESLSNPNVEVLSTGSSKVQVTDPDVGSAPENEEENKHQKKMWQLRENQLQRILSMPHEENCPLYPYSRCKKAGIDFNLGSGVKQNLDQKLITNGVLVELNVLAFELKSSAEDFLTEILQYNFNLNFEDQLSYYVFARHIMARVKHLNSMKKFSRSRNRAPFQFHDLLYINKSSHRRNYVCPKCFLHRKNKACQVEPDSDHMRHPRPHPLSDTVSAEANCMELNPANDPSTSSPTFEETIMDGYPKCKEVGLSLCINKEKPKEKLSTSVLTNSIMKEVASFANILAGRHGLTTTVNEILEHNFNFGGFVLLNRPKPCFLGLAWFDEVYVYRPRSLTEPPKLKAGAVTERKEKAKERMLAMQANKERVILPGQRLKKCQSRRYPVKSACRYPVCMEIGLDLDMKSKSQDKEKLDLKLLTQAAVFEIHKFLYPKRGYFPGLLYEVLDYNFDISSQHHRIWEFSIAAASSVTAMLKRYRRDNQPDEVFKLPLFPPKRTPGKKPGNETNGKASNAILTNKSKESDSLLQGNLQIKQEEDDAHCGDVKREPDTEETCHPGYDEVKSEPNDEDVKYLVPSEPAGSCGSTSTTSPIYAGSIKTESAAENVLFYILAEPPQAERETLLVTVPKSESGIKPESDTSESNVFVPAEAPESQR